MGDKFKNKYRIASARAQWWDYGWKGAYFITICTHKRGHFFGNIVEMRFIASPFTSSPLGQMAETIWHEIPIQFPYAALGDFVVMPSHIHGILILDEPKNGNGNGNVNIETRLIASLQTTEPLKTGGFAGNKNPMVNDNISRITRWHNGRCTFEIRKMHADFAWQPRFHDHIIRDDAEYQRISDYIINNPVKWRDDKFYTT